MNQTPEEPVMNRRRPYVQVRPYTWNAQDGTQTRGVALMHGLSVRAHMTPEEAHAAADKIHDAAERVEARPPRQRIVTRTGRPTLTQTSANGTEEPPLPTSIPDRE